MRWSALLLVPLFVVACDREPVAPDVDVTPTFAATSEWSTLEIAFPPEGVDLGIETCTGQQALGFGGVSVRFHRVTTPNGSFIERFSSELWDTYRWLINGEFWVPVTVFIHGSSMFDSDGSLRVNHFGTLQAFRNQTTGVIMSGMVVYHVTTDANGEIRVDHWLEPPCKWR